MKLLHDLRILAPDTLFLFYKRSCRIAATPRRFEFGILREKNSFPVPLPTPPGVDVILEQLASFGTQQVRFSMRAVIGAAAPPSRT